MSDQPIPSNASLTQHLPELFLYRHYVLNIMFTSFRKVVLISC